MSLTDVLIAITDDDKLVFIDKNSFKQNPQLKNANIFNRLFGLIDDDENDTWQSKPMEKDLSGNILLLKNLQINQGDWNLFAAYIRHGIPPYFYTMKHNSFSHQAIINKVESINETCNKFGGIPSFDEFYEKFILSDEINAADDYYNPFQPSEDTKNKYNWVLCYESRATEMSNLRQTGWNCVKEIRNNYSSSTWWRKLKHYN